jgi:hypothetical protein
MAIKGDLADYAQRAPFISIWTILIALKSPSPNLNTGMTRPAIVLDSIHSCSHDLETGFLGSIVNHPKPARRES